MAVGSGATAFTYSLGFYPVIVLGPYRSPVAGYAALVWLITFVALPCGIAVYAAPLWPARRLSGPASPARPEPA